MSGLGQDLKIAKTVKLFINGEFPRTESGRSYPVFYSKSKTLYAHLCLASKKDFRNSVTAAREAQKSWAAKSAYNRSQILYRMAEMTEGKRAEFVDALKETLGLQSAAADKAVSDAISALIYYAGFADKYAQVIGAVNPVAGPHHNFTTPEAVGTVVYVASEKFDFAHVLRAISSIICSGNSLVVLMQREGSALLAPLAEMLATSDLSKGVVNLLSGDVTELCDTIGSHMEVESLCYDGGDTQVLNRMKELSIENFKRVTAGLVRENNLQNILSFVEYKTVWHPIG